ncbi:MAG: dioxygenase [Rhodocyclales bacterium]|nr:dioxygenase [Rhodocyclales bacterium]
MNPIPPIFLSHGSPMLLLEPGRSGPAWQALAHALPRPRAILAVSAHWTTRLPAVSAAPRPATIHDFYGFPEALYDLDYPAPGSADLATQIACLIPGIHIDAGRGLDHGAWSPLRAMYPQADIPVIQLAVMPGADAVTHCQLGRKLEPLTRDGVLVLASGGLTHNLGDMVPDAPDGAALRHVAEFRDWFAAALARNDLPALMQWESLAPHARRAHPTAEHLLPLFVALGAAGENARVDNVHRDYQLGALALDAFRFDHA